MDPRPLTKVDIAIDTNLWWTDAFQFGDPADFTWSLAGKNFFLSIKQDDAGTTPALLALTSAAGQIVVLDPVNRIIAMAVTDLVIRSALAAPNQYVYDLIMVDAVTGQTDGLMYGNLQVNTGITIGPS